MSGCIAIPQEKIADVHAAFTGVNRKRNQVLFLTGIWSGFRASDLVRLKFKDFISNRVWLDSLVKREKKTGKIRTVDIGKEFSKQVHTYICRRIDEDFVHEDEFLFPKSNGEMIKPKSLIEVIKSAMYAAGFPAQNWSIGTHCMRKTYSFILLNDLLGSGMPVQEALIVLQAALGHSSLATTIAYIGWDLMQVQNANKRHGGRKLV